MAFANGLLMSVPSFLWTECNNRVSQQNQPNTKKLKQQALMKHMRLKKQTVLKSYMRWKRKKRTSETANCISLQKRRYIFCRKTLFTTKHKTLKRQKKAKRQHLKTMDCGLFFSSEAISSFFKEKTSLDKVKNASLRNKFFHFLVCLPIIIILPMLISQYQIKKKYILYGQECFNFEIL